MEIREEEIQLIPIDDNTTLFFHTDTLQIYPFKNENKIVPFLSSLKTFGKEQTRQQYGEEDFDMYYNFVCDTIANAPLSHETELPKKTNPFQFINLPISGHCNLNCPYCFAQTDGGFKFDDYTKEDMIKILDYVISQNVDEKQSLTIAFFGGEPLLKFDIILFTIQYVKETYPKRVISYSITTNGTILTDEIIQVFKENNFSVLVSIDGPDNNFNLRTYKNGVKSIQDVVKNIGIMREKGVFIQLRATLVNTNPYIVETFDFFEHLQIPFYIIFAYSLGKENRLHTYGDYSSNNLESIKKQFEKLTDYYITKIKNKENIYNRLLSDNSTILRYRQKKNYVCLASINYFTITANGDIFSCVHFANNKKYSVGNIFQKGIEEDKNKDYKVLHVKELKQCTNCWIKNLCLGGCMSEKVCKGNGNEGILGEHECELQRIVWEFYLKLYYYIMTYAPGYLIKKEKEKKEVVC